MKLGHRTSIAADNQAAPFLGSEHCVALIVLQLRLILLLEVTQKVVIFVANADFIALVDCRPAGIVARLVRQPRWG